MSEAQTITIQTANRHAFFGDLHLHTNNSFDAYVLMGTKVTPEQAYKFAKGEEIEFLGEKIRRDTPLDFLAVTDHSENLGIFNTLSDSESELSNSLFGRLFKIDFIKNNVFLKFFAEIKRGKGDIPGVDTKEISSSAWKKHIQTTNEQYQPGKFTTFIAYEWTAMPDGQNLHRNIIFKGDHAPLPFTAYDSDRPEDLWTYLDNIRLKDQDVIAIPHNSNASNGLLFSTLDSDGKKFDDFYALRRSNNEPLIEISQNKGTSETHPILSPNDEYAGFELFDHLLLNPKIPSQAHGSYAREALAKGLSFSDQRLVRNPFQFGFVGGSDFHNGLSASSENAYIGLFGGADPTKHFPNTQEFAETITKLIPITQGQDTDKIFYENSSSGLTGVWAESNTREAIFDALKRRETFATSGTKLQCRLFASWEFDQKLIAQNDWVSTAYTNGVPMGSYLPNKPANQKAPIFLAWGLKDPNGVNLERIQIIKLWSENNQEYEKIFDVIISRKTEANNQNSGSVELKTVWTDPEFNPKLHAAYYLRVLEVPTPRWSSVLAKRKNQPSPKEVPEFIQERGWSSPIWYQPKTTE